MRQILLNLVANALKVTLHGEVVTRVRALTMTDAQATTHFEVQDTGIGMPAEFQSRLFARFTQADGSTTRKYDSTGLGLVICKRLVQMVGGEIGVESADGQGSTCWFTVQLQRDATTRGFPTPVIVWLAGASWWSKAAPRITRSWPASYGCAASRW
ncbi:MAG: ATP-binding protein [Chloroflexota bacterium]